MPEYARHRRPIKTAIGSSNQGLPVWYHEPCGHINMGPWWKGKICGGCHYEVVHPQHVNHYVMYKVAGSNPDPAEAGADG